MQPLDTSSQSDDDLSGDFSWGSQWNASNSGRSPKRRWLMKNRQMLFAVFSVLGMFAVGFGIGLLVGGRGDEGSSSSNETGGGKTEPTENQAAFPPTWAALALETDSLMNRNANPCDDFYEFTCGGFASRMPANFTGMNVRAFQMVYEKNFELLSRLVDEQWPILYDLHRSCVESDSSRTSSDVLQPIISRLEQFVSSPESDQSQSHTALMQIIGFLTRQGVRVIFDAGILPDFYLQPSYNRVAFIQGSMPYFANYDQQDVSDIADLFMATPALHPAVYADRSAAIAGAFAAASFEKNLATLAPAFSWNNLEANLHNVSYVQLLADTQLNFSAFFEEFLSTDVREFEPRAGDTVMFGTPTYFSNLYSSLNRTIALSGKESFRDYAHWRMLFAFINSDVVVASSLPLNTRAFVSKMRLAEDQTRSKRSPDFVPLVSLPTQPQKQTRFSDSSDRHEICVDAVDNLLGDFVGHLFTDITLTENTRSAVDTIVSGIAGVFRSAAQSLQWLDAPSLKATIDKVDAIIPIVGHPRVLSTYRKLRLDSSDSFASSVGKVTAFNIDREIRKHRMIFARANESTFPATIVNAFYSPETNTINFPAGILESPFFSSTGWPILAQFARMGFVIGHELTHAFDSGGRFWGPVGNYGDWLSRESGIEFDKKAQCLVTLYDSFEVGKSGETIDGQKTLGENIADLGGVKYAYAAYENWREENGDEFHGKELLSGYSRDQLFWIFLGQTWCTQASDEATLSVLRRDVHSTSKWRVNGPLSQFDGFAEAFKCPVGSKMNPTSKCPLW